MAFSSGTSGTQPTLSDINVTPLVDVVLVLLIIFAGSLLDVVYFFPVIRTAFFDKMPQDETLNSERDEKVEVYVEKKSVLESRQPIYLLMIVPLAITAIFSILLCLFPNTLRIYDLAQRAVDNIFGGM